MPTRTRYLCHSLEESDEGWRGEGMTMNSTSWAHKQWHIRPLKLFKSHRAQAPPSSRAPALTPLPTARPLRLVPMWPLRSVQCRHESLVPKRHPLLPPVCKRSVRLNCTMLLRTTESGCSSIENGSAAACETRRPSADPLLYGRTCVWCRLFFRNSVVPKYPSSSPALTAPLPTGPRRALAALASTNAFDINKFLSHTYMKSYPNNFS